MKKHLFIISIMGGEPEYKANGSFVGARRPHLLGGGREFFAKITMKNNLISKVE